ncbi:MAG: Rieske 2Fe-2S domain-containing protein [Betaproteobacteria bacterium]|nr:Rieske 2Fe-2S domain-containing protein [Betaproteobacteria bacterium]
MADEPACLARREFLLTGGKLVLLASVAGLPTPLLAQRAEFGAQRLSRLDELTLGKGLWFDYPRPGLANVLVKLGVPAGGGIGPERDIVAFSARCTHLGGDLGGSLQAAQQVLGPCPRHLTTFDLTRHGVVITGHATQSLPQVVLDLRGSELFAVGMMGLVFGAGATYG